MSYRYQYLDPQPIIESDDFKVVESFLKAIGRTQIGWHYIVDLTWIYSKAKQWPKGIHVLDAGGGRGPVQFLLAELGFDVTNIDLFHTKPSYLYHHRYGLELEKLNSYVETSYVDHITNFGRYRILIKKSLNWLLERPLMRDYIVSIREKKIDRWKEQIGISDVSTGKIKWLKGNLCNAPEIDTATFDAVVSLSALEHIPLGIIPDAINEIKRMVKSDGYFAITTSGTEQENTWFHTPSQGYCFSTTDIQNIFNALPEDKYSQVNFNCEIGKIKDSYFYNKYLQQNLAIFYRLSGKNGMPWGKWNPAYIPVAIYDDNKNHHANDKR